MARLGAEALKAAFIFVAGKYLPSTLARAEGLEAGAVKSTGTPPPGKTTSSEPLTTCLAPPACFAAGTLIHTAQGLQAIETFKGGELVLSRHEHTHKQGYRTVVGTKVTHDQTLIEVVVQDTKGQSETLHTTSEHPFWVEDLGNGQSAWVKASALHGGMLLTDSTGHTLTVISQIELAQKATVYNIEVEEHHTYHVGQFGVWVHNANCCDVLGQNPITPAPISGNLSKGKLSSEAITLDTPAIMRPAIQDIRINGDITGKKTENLTSVVLQADSNIVTLVGTKYGADNGLDHVVQFIDPQSNKLMTMIIDSKQLAKSGATSLDPKAAGGVMQLSDASLDVVMRNIGDTQATLAIKMAQDLGTLIKAVAYLDKVSGALKIVRVNP